MTGPTPPYLIPVRRSAVPGYGMQGLCPQCRDWTGIWPHDHPHGAGRLDNHATEKGSYCPMSRTVITNEAAIARDSQLNPQEQAAYNATAKRLHGCRGPRLDENCWHPACHQAVAKGLVWTLDGWKPATRIALF
jgi:hypothetical protein